MAKIINAAFAVLMITIFACCSHDLSNDSVHDDHEGSSIAVTQYTDSTEIFMEYPELIVNEEAKFLIHLTDLKNFKAVIEGVLFIEFISQKGIKTSLTEDRPTRDGIYIPSIKFTEAGNYKMIITLKGQQVSDKIIIENIIVYRNENEIPYSEDGSSSNISFLKEQQWKIDFSNEVVIKRIMQNSVVSTGEIKAKPELFTKVVSPIVGIILSKYNSELKSIGTFVKKGETLLNISPSAYGGVNIQKIKNDFLLAQSEYERTQKLFNQKAISKKRLNESKFDYDSKRASYNSIMEQVKISESGYEVISPIDGYIENINFILGKQVISGDELFTIINPSRLLLKANVPSTQFEAANNSVDATFKVEGINNEYKVSLLDGKKISVAASLNEANRTLSVYFEFKNPENKLKIGMYAEVHIKVGEANEYLSISESALINEDGLHTVYVQTEGETFEKRILKTGIIDNGYVQVIDGLNIGERVVIVGAYQVRLAALSPESAIGHGHVH